MAVVEFSALTQRRYNKANGTIRSPFQFSIRVAIPLLQC
jgi:hypothetical protein